MIKIAFVVCALVAMVTSIPLEGNIPQVAQSLGLTELLKLVTEAGLASTLSSGGPFTVFAPTDEAFAKLPKPIIHRLSKNKTELADLLKYHVVSGTVKSTDLKNELLAPSLFSNINIRINIYDDGKIITADGSPVIKADQFASNGVIHVVDKVLFPVPEGTVTDIVAKDPAFSTLLKAVQAAKLASTLAGAGPFTVFAPTNEAFGKLPPGELEKLLANVTELTAVLEYHVVSGTFYSEGLMQEQDVPTLEGKSVHIVKKGDGNVEVNNAMVELPNLSVTNGVIHVINNVLIPPTLKKNKSLSQF